MFRSAQSICRDLIESPGLGLAVYRAVVQNGAIAHGTRNIHGRYGWFVVDRLDSISRGLAKMVSIRIPW